MFFIVLPDLTMKKTSKKTNKTQLAPGPAAELDKTWSNWSLCPAAAAEAPQNPPPAAPPPRKAPGRQVWCHGKKGTTLMGQWIGLRENSQESPIFNGKIYGFRLNFSLKPI